MLTDITKSFGSKIVLDGVTLHPTTGVTCILGASGSGKTTLLNLIAGLITPDSGEITKTRASYVFQDDRLIPTMTVEGNLHYALTPSYPDTVERTAVISEVLGAVELTAERGSYPRTLSGGMLKRVSLARAFAHPSGTILLDEPFRSLDPMLRLRLYKTLDALMEENKTAIFVTHDVEEALLIANFIYLLRDGTLRLVHTDDTPRADRTITSVAPKCEEIMNLME